MSRAWRQLSSACCYGLSSGFRGSDGPGHDIIWESCSGSGTGDSGTSPLPKMCGAVVQGLPTSLAKTSPKTCHKLPFCIFFLLQISLQVHDRICSDCTSICSDSIAVVSWQHQAVLSCTGATRATPNITHRPDFPFPGLDFAFCKAKTWSIALWTLCQWSLAHSNTDTEDLKPSKKSNKGADGSLLHSPVTALTFIATVFSGKQLLGRVP